MCLYTLRVAYYSLMQHIFIPTDKSGFGSLCSCASSGGTCVRAFDQSGINSHLHVESSSPPFLGKAVTKQCESD